MTVELRRLFDRLQARTAGRIEEPAEDPQGWIDDLASYDTALVAACDHIAIRSPFRAGDRLTAADRVALTRALLEAGVDVRGTSSTAPGS